MSNPQQNSDVLIYVQHLLGIGHLRRAVALSNALVASGLKVTFVSGGFPVPGLEPEGADFIQLPPVRVEGENFRVLIGEDGQEVDEAFRAGRRAQLLKLLEHCRPAALLTEMFPFGRRQMRFELDPLVAAARDAGVLVISSIRDVLTTHKTPGKGEWILEKVQGEYDAVLVHGDPAFIRLEESFPLAVHIPEKLHYTGYVLSETEAVSGPVEQDRREGVLVSAGGGAVAEPLIAAVLELSCHPDLPDDFKPDNCPWRILLGPNLSEESFAAFAKAASAGVEIERNRSDFTTLLGRARLSISQAGYNTIMETLQAQTEAIVVPFHADTQSEQTTRAEKLAERGLLSVVSEKELSANSLLEALKRRKRVPGLSLKVDGARESAHIIGQLLDRG
ncbi:glycosyltransferase family protein [Kiloniella sp. b19]|uniref:glycosyltransferase family protein n=1 Tax=Kiloniella sp. GXU_MW_B19 TaxID=3141326 RepID=UPI0031E369E8